MTEIEVKLNRLGATIRAMQCPVVALSGGMVSTFLAAVVQKVMQEPIYAVTLMPAVCPNQECVRAQEIAVRLGLSHHVIDLRPGVEIERTGEMEKICLFCDQMQGHMLVKWIKEQRLSGILTGYRVKLPSGRLPGKEVREYLKNPLMNSTLTQEEIEAISYGWGLLN